MYFAEATRVTFSFLEAAGFRISESDWTHVTYTSHRSAVTIAWDVRSGELSVFFGLNHLDKQPAERISLTDLLAAEGADAAGSFQVHDESKLGRSLPSLRRPLRPMLNPRLRRPHVLSTATDLEKRAGSGSMRNLRFCAFDRPQGGMASELPNVVALYRSIECDLTAAEKAVAFACVIRHVNHEAAARA